MQLKWIKTFLQLFRKTFNELKKNDPLRIAAATAFFTTFALPAILIILIQVFGLLINPAKLSTRIFQHLQVVLGTESSEQVRNTLEGFTKLAKNIYITVGGFLFLVFVATTLFNVLSNSLNQLWNVKVREKTSFLYKLKLRAKSAAVIVATGLLFLANLVMEALQSLLHNYLSELLHGHGGFLFTVLTQVLAITIVTMWFTILFKFLANAHPSWKTAAIAGTLTGVLFTMGKVVLGLLLTFSNIRTIFGASGSFVLILLFVFYSSFILYFGGMFTKVWATYHNEQMQVDAHAYEYTLSEIKNG